MKKIALLIVLALVGLLINSNVNAEGTYYNIGTSTSNNGSPDVVSWSQAYPIVVDSYGHYIVPTQRAGQTVYDLSFSNDKGATWSVNTTVNIPARASAAYDPINDTLLTLSADGGTGDVTFNRYIIRRNTDYTISDFTQDEKITPLLIDEEGACADSSAGNPIIIIQDINGVNKVVLFWSVSKTGCGVAGDLTSTRASYLDITNSATDDDIVSFHSLTNAPSGIDEASALIAATDIYSANSVEPFFQHSALIKKAGSYDDDIFYFNIKENGEHQFIRYLNNGNDWSNGPTAPEAFGGIVNDAQGYPLKRELLTKPVEATGQDLVYVGISRWLDNTNGDTQSLFSTNGGGMNLAGNVYSAGGTHCLYPTFDIGYDQVANSVYSFYDITGPASTCGHAYYKTFDGATFGAATPFYTVTNRSVDIPVVYQNRVNDKMELFFRVNNAGDPATPPHEIFYGYVGLNSTITPSSIVANGPNNHQDSLYEDFNRVCAIESNVSLNDPGDFAFSAVTLKNEFVDNFEPRVAPYKLVFNDNWYLPETWNPGIFEPEPNGEVIINNANGAYLMSRQTFTAPTTFEFYATFTAHNFEHVGIVDSEGFGRYAIFSTGGDATLKSRISNGGGETNQNIGNASVGTMHKYTLVWTAGAVDFFIDDVLQNSLTGGNIPTGAMRVMLTNNAQNGAANLSVDTAKVLRYAPSSGTYTSCPIDSGINNAEWTQAFYDATVSAGHTYSVQVRTSNDLTTWSSWSASLSSGATIGQPLGRYAQYLITVGSSNPLTTPRITDVNLLFEEPNIPPVALDDNVTTPNATPIDISVLANDSDSDGTLDVSSISVTVQGTNGTAVANTSTGVITYTPTGAFAGVDTFTYEICDNDGDCDTAIVSVTVNPPNVPPVANAENSSTTKDSAVQIDVLANDTDSDGTLDPGTLTITVQGTKGAAVANTTTGIITYTPHAGQTGSDTFTYEICDDDGDCDTAVVSITINEPSQNEDDETDGVGTSGSTQNPETCSEGPGNLSPEILTALANSPKTIKLTFKAGNGSFDKFRIQYSKESGSFSETNSVTVDKAEDDYIFQNFNEGTKYFFRIRAEKNGCNDGIWSKEFIAETLGTAVPSQNEEDDVSASENLPTSAPANANGGFNNMIIVFCCVGLILLLLILFLFRKRKEDKEDEIPIRRKF